MVAETPRTLLLRAALRLVEVSGLHFFMPDYSCLFVFREADRDFEIKARNPDKAGPRDMLVFLRILKGVNLLWASLSQLARLFADTRDCFRENWFRIFVGTLRFFSQKRRRGEKSCVWISPTNRR